MLQGFGSDRDEINDFHQRVADRNIQSINDREEEIEHAKNGFIGMLAGILVGGIIGWIFLGPTTDANKEHSIPVIRRPLIPFKVQPNDPGGMEIDNQDRNIYHIVDNTSKEIKEVNIRQTPDIPKLVVEKTTPTPSDIDSLVENIDKDLSLNNEDIKLEETEENKVEIAKNELSEINTNSKEKIVIPTKIKQIDVAVQDSVNSVVSEVKEVVSKPENKVVKKEEIKSTKGTWYAQIIASSSRSSVEKLWRELSSKHSFLKEHYHEIEEITAGNKSTLYRLKVGAFKTRKEAETLSSKLKENKVGNIIKQN